jgi:predicted GNAT family acetyltransferase
LGLNRLISFNYNNINQLAMRNFEALATHDDLERRFTVTLADGAVGNVRYEWRTDVPGQPRVMRLLHTFVPRKVRGLGQASLMTQAVLTELAAMGVLVEPVCPYTQNFMKRHTARWGHLLAPPAI